MNKDTAKAKSIDEELSEPLEPLSLEDSADCRRLSKENAGRNFIQEVPNSFSIFVKRKGQYLVDVHGTIVATIDFPVHFKNLEEGVEVEMIFRPREKTPYCKVCNGSGQVYIGDSNFSFVRCHSCAGTGKAEMRNRVQELEDAIRKHRSQKADDRCIEDDDELYAALGDGIKCDRRVGDKIAMLENCARFIERRCEGGGWPTHQELEADRDKWKALVEPENENEWPVATVPCDDVVTMRRVSVDADSLRCIRCGFFLKETTPTGASYRTFVHSGKPIL